MKFLITVSAFVLFNLTVFAQYSGVTRAGRLIPAVKQTETADNIPPAINLKYPAAKENDTITVGKNTLSLAGSILDADDSVRLFINNLPVQLNDEKQFQYIVNLEKGVNQFRLRAVDKSKNTSMFEFYILSIPVNAKPKITLLDPQITEGNEISVSEKMITIRGQVDTKTGLSKVFVNDNNANLLTKNEFFINYELSYGINKINIKAIDSDGSYSDKKIIINWTPDITGPVVQILYPPVSRGIKIVSKSDVLTLKGKAEDESGIFEVTVNNRQASLEPDGTFNINLYLHVGDNPLIVKAVDNKYNVTVDTFIVKRNLESVITSGRYIALVIGIDSYQGYWPPLKNAVHDAESVAEALKKDYLFNKVITLFDKQATRDNIIHELEKLTNSVKSSDNLLIYYSGHGQFKKELNKGYWVPVDAKTNSIADFISNNEIKTFMGAIPAKHTLLISDACFAGDIFRGKPTESIPFNPNNMERYFKEVYNKPSRVAMTSGGMEEVEDSGKNGHSIFTYYLLKALRENKNRYMDATQLFNDFRIAVTNNSDQTPMLQVVRDTGDEGGHFIFVKK